MWGEKGEICWTVYSSTDAERCFSVEACGRVVFTGWGFMVISPRILAPERSHGEGWAVPHGSPCYREPTWGPFGVDPLKFTTVNACVALRQLHTALICKAKCSPTSVEHTRRFPQTVCSLLNVLIFDFMQRQNDNNQGLCFTLNKLLRRKREYFLNWMNTLGNQKLLCKTHPQSDIVWYWGYMWKNTTYLPINVVILLSVAYHLSDKGIVIPEYFSVRLPIVK